MSVKMIQVRLNSYGCQSTLEEEQALREITQEIALAALGRTDFFKLAAFQGGTCLRIFHGLNRFSEDLDFALLQPDDSFSLKPYLSALTTELKAYGYGLDISDRSRVDQSVRMAFMKDDSLGNMLRLNHKPDAGPLRKLKIKLEVDTNPPGDAKFETRCLDFPFPSAVCMFDLPSLFAGKLHALLCREYLKGRDLYDFIWYTSQRMPANYALLSTALNQMGSWKKQGVQADRSWCVEQLRDKIKATNWDRARKDVHRFVKPNELQSLDLWSREFFLSQADKLA